MSTSSIVLTSLLIINSCTYQIPAVPIYLPHSQDWKTSYKTDDMQIKDRIFDDSSPSNEEKEINKSTYQNTCWWKLYNNDELNDLEQKALHASPTLQAALYRYEQALNSLGITETQLYPSISFAVQASRTRIAKDLLPTIPTQVPEQNDPSIAEAAQKPSIQIVKGPTHVNSLHIGTTVNYELDLWGRIKLERQGSWATAQACQEDVETIKLLLTQDIAYTYYTILYYQADLQLAQLIHDSMMKEREILEALYKSGVADVKEYLRCDIRQKQLQTEIISLTFQKEKSIHLLASLIGKEPSQFTLQEQKVIWNPIYPKVGVPAKTLQARPDIRKAQFKLNALLNQLGSAKTAYLPNISLTGLFGFDSLKANRLLQWQNRIWDIGTSLGVSLLDAGRRKYTINAIQAAFQASTCEYINACLTAIREVEEAFLNYQAKQEEKTAALDQQSKEELFCKLYDDQYIAGIIPLHIFLQHYHQSLSARRQTLLTDFNLQISSLNLIKAIGGTLQEASE